MSKSELQAHRHRLEAVRDDAAFVSAWRETLACLADAGASGDFDALLDGPDGEEVREIFAPFQRRYLTVLEIAVAERLQTLDRDGKTALSRVFDDPFARTTYERVAEAVELVDFGYCRRFVDIGCGPFPAAALLIHDQTAVPRIIALDNDAVAVGHASRVVHRCASARLRVLHGDGIRHDFSRADVIYVANHVVPKARVLRRIGETAPSGTRVLVREPWGLGRLLAERVGDRLPPRFERLSAGVQDANFYSQHLLCALTDGPAVARPVAG